jgi:hypothetical protein
MPNKERPNDDGFCNRSAQRNASISELAWGSGLELVAKLADGSIRRPSMAETLPFTLLSPEEGKVRLLAIPEGAAFAI